MAMMGVDPELMKKSIEDFMSGQRMLLERINENQNRLEAGMIRLESSVSSLAQKLSSLLDPGTGNTVELRTAEGERTGVLETTERFPQRLVDEVMQGPPGGA
jgi:hypothetical protein